MKIVIKDASTGAEGSPFVWEQEFPRRGETVLLEGAEFRVLDVVWSLDLVLGDPQITLLCGQVLQGEEGGQLG